jgi:hypothetical protein
MTLTLTDEQQKALAGQCASELRLIHPQTNEAYVLVRADQYERVKEMLENENDDLRDTYPAQIESAMRAGWSDPEMDKYDDYDANREKSCR